MKSHGALALILVCLFCSSFLYGTWRIKHTKPITFEETVQKGKKWRETRDGRRETTDHTTYTLRYTVVGFADVKIDTVGTRNWYSWSNTNN